MIKITVFGTGYVGLVTGICFAELGCEVVCVDIDKEKISLLQQGISPVYENQIEELLAKNMRKKTISFTSDAKRGIVHGDYLFIAVGTPSAIYGSANLQYVYDVARTIGQNLAKNCLVIDKSTVPVGTGEKVKSIIKKELHRRKLTNITFDVVSNPEFLKQGDAINDFMHSDRIIIGTENKQAFAKMEALYAPLNARIIHMGIRSAELAKYAANAFLATKISFINEMAWLCQLLDADISDIKMGIGTDPRIGMDFLNAGCGYGGSCFPKDVKALIWMAKEHGLEVPLFEAVENINMRQKCIIFNKIKQYFNDELKDKTIALWGLAFKPKTDDMREAPSKVLLELLWQAGAKIQVYDPVAMKEAKRIYGNRHDLIFCHSKENALNDAHALAIVTEWDEFKNPDFAAMKKQMQNLVIFDGRNIYDPKKIISMGFDYFCIGKNHGKTL